ASFATSGCQSRSFRGRMQNHHASTQTNTPALASVASQNRRIRQKQAAVRATGAAASGPASQRAVGPSNHSAADAHKSGGISTISARTRNTRSRMRRQRCDGATVAAGGMTGFSFFWLEVIIPDLVEIRDLLLERPAVFRAGRAVVAQDLDEIRRYCGAFRKIRVPEVAGRYQRFDKGD